MYTYIYRFGHGDLPYGPKCVNIAKEAAHVELHCHKFTARQTGLVTVAGRCLSSEIFILETTGT